MKVKIRNRTIAKRTSRVCPLLGQLKHYDSTKGVSLLQLQSCWESEPRYISVILFYVFRARTGRTRRTWTKNRTERTNVDERDRRDGHERTTDVDKRGRTGRTQCGPYTVLTPRATCYKNGQTERTGQI